MRLALLSGVSLAMLAATPALAQAPATNAQVLERLNALEQRLDALQARNAELERQLSAARQAQATNPATPPPADFAGRRPSAPPPAPAASSGGADTAKQVAANAPPVTWTVVPQFNSPDGRFTFKPRGILDVDYAAFNERKGGYDFNNGTQIRRGRFGFDGTMFKDFAWRLEAEYVGGNVALLDAYVAYTRIPHFTFTLGQLKVPAGLEANSSDSFNEFLERGMANIAFGVVGGERRVGATVAFVNPLITATGGVYGANESISRNPASPGEVWSVNGRVTLEPINQPGRLIHVGASAYRAMHIAGKDLTIADRPDVRVDNGNIESVAFTNLTSSGAINPLGATVKDGTYYDIEAAGILGPFSVQGEYNHLHLNRLGGLPSPTFDGWYVFGSAFLTGDTRKFKGGLIDRLTPKHPFDPFHGTWGAFELAARYDRFNLTAHDISPLDRDAHSFTGALNWYLTGNVKILFNYIRFTGDHSPLVVAPVSINGTTAKGEAYATRLHFDF